MFTKILIANRGEIACRVIATCRKLHIKTVAVFSDADADAKHVAMADEAVNIGASPVAESYLKGDRIVEAALRTGAQAIHPGYGFLSENPEFVEAVVAAGLVFIGPSADAIRSMGLKDAAKAMMEKAGVPVVPGYHGSEQDLDFLKNEAETIGYPVMIKARAGGGGKGMRLVDNASKFESSLLSAQRESLASFGDAVCLIEKYVTQPRHIEIQIFGDSHGNVVHLFERDCSLQRRHQKVIEEAPAPDMTDEMRSAMGSAAVEAAKAVEYQGAGTVEFIIDSSEGLRPDRFWFMEMNTRLQVEHPVTEAITGLDLVELQLNVAAGDKLPFSQDDLTINGWSFEARLYAEDVPKGFLPATGRLDHLIFPNGTEFEQGSTRIDSGVRQGDEISSFYDPMIAKIVTHGPNRQSALKGMSDALADCRISGITTNVAFLGALAKNSEFSNGDVDTGLIDRNLDDLSRRDEPSEIIISLAAVASLGLLTCAQHPDPWDTLTGWRQWFHATQYALLDMGDLRLECEVEILNDQEFKVIYNGSAIEFQIKGMGDTRLMIMHQGHSAIYDLTVVNENIAIYSNGLNYQFAIPMFQSDNMNEDALDNDSLSASMPGSVIVVSATAGQSVSKGDTLIVLEAMKMEHSLLAPRDGIIQEVLTSKGDQVEDGARLLTLVPIEE